MWNLKFVLVKERSEKYWPRLLKQKTRLQNVKVDWCTVC